MAKNEDIHLKVIVNGKGIPMKVSPDVTLGTLVEPALEKAKVALGPDADRWEFSNAAGQTLDKSKLVGSFGFVQNDEISLSLSAGVVG